MNILICTGVYPPDIGGPATYVKILERELPRQGFDIKIVTYSDKNERNSDNLKKIYRGKNILLRYFEFFLQIIKSLDWSDLIYVQGSMSEGVPASLAAKLKRKKYVLKIAGDHAWEQGRQRFGVKDSLDNFQEKKYGTRVEIIRFLQKQVAKGAGRVIVPSKYLKKIVLGWGVEEKKIEVVYNAVKFTDVKVMNKPANERWLVTVARLTPWKGIDTLIDLMPILLKEFPNLKLKIIGDGSEFENLESRILNLGLENSVNLLGRLANKETLAYIKSADMFILNSAYEGLSHVILEALSLGTPVLASDVGGNPEVLQNGKIGELFGYNNKEEIKEKLVEALRSGSLRQSLDKEKKEFLENFSTKRMIDRISTTLKHV
ncbi:MAG: glycosyltransferase [Candidatus Magasanikbacteria bacterium]|nr:glycosyltransferase [Candidatus Magasanikbacteria bacterium]